MATIIETTGLRKTYGSFEAVKDISLTVHESSICAFLGQNGAGKSSTIKMLLGMVRPTGGTGTVLGNRIDREPESLRIRQQTAFVAEDKRLYDYMTVDEIIRFTRSFFRTWNFSYERELLQRFQLPTNRRVRQLSKGMRTKLALLLGFARGCPLLILDEPTEGLDPLAVEQVLEIVVSLAAQGTTIFFSSHQIAEVEQIADHILMINGGRLVLDASVDDLKEKCCHIRAVFSEPVYEQDFRITGIEDLQLNGRAVSLKTFGSLELITHHIRMLCPDTMEVAPLTLKEIFLDRVKARS